ncbi:MAG: dihydroneopterin aldolase [Candidatus Latescibacterota bacterium]|jgi:dihydroneopterin aldolase
MSADTIRLRNMRFYAYHGLFDEEAQLGQRFEIDLELKSDLRQAGLKDDLKLSIDYSTVYKTVAEIVTQQRFKLIEALAEHIAAQIGRTYAPIALVVRVRKPNPPVPGDFDGIEVEIQRQYE